MAELRRERIFTFPFVLLMVANGLLRTGTQMLIALVPLYVLDQGASPAVAGLTTTLYMTAAVVLRPLSGSLVDTRGRYVIMVAGAALYCAASGLYVLMLPIWALLAVRVMQGAGFALNGTAVMTLAADLIPERRMSEGIGYLGVEQTVAQLLGPWAALELREAVGYQCAFAVAFGCGAVNVLLRLPLRSAAGVDALRMKAAPRRPEGEPAKRPVRFSGPLWTRLIDRDAWRPASVMFLLMFGTAGINTFMAAYALGRGIGNSGLFFVASGLTLAVSRLTAGRIERRWGTVWVMAPGITLVVLGQVGVWWCPNPLVLMLSGASCGLGMGAVQPTLNSLAVLAVGRERRGRANSTFFMAMDLSQAVGAVTLGAVAGATGTGSVFLVTAALSTASLTGYLVLKSRSLLP
ncbi:MFS transporter [Actinomadura darangshiensis]|uniref:MFS transporter n=1 Tax=Actinomadura darangshiensis TaxID=705336 RepID=UPI00140E5F7B|nr:MFS transporter [Actinomadura darangshiensis]